MAKKQTTKKRTKVKDLPQKEKALRSDDMKKVKGGTNIGLKAGAPKKGDVPLRLIGGNQFQD